MSVEENLRPQCALHDLVHSTYMRTLTSIEERTIRIEQNQHVRVALCATRGVEINVLQKDIQELKEDAVRQWNDLDIIKKYINRIIGGVLFASFGGSIVANIILSFFRK